MLASGRAQDLIKRFEGCKLEAYQDQKGIWTIGWGTTGPGITAQTPPISQGTADAMLLGHIREMALSLTDLLGNTLPQNRFDALTSLVYNIGMQAFRTSTMLRLIKAKDFEGASAQFLLWDHTLHAVNPGLLERRLAEQALFDTP